MKRLNELYDIDNDMVKIARENKDERKSIAKQGCLAGHASGLD